MSETLRKKPGPIAGSKPPRPGSIAARVMDELRFFGSARTKVICAQLKDLDDTAVAIALRRLRALGLVKRIDTNPQGRGHHAVWSLVTP